MDIHTINQAYERLANAEIGRYSAAVQLAEAQADIERKKAAGLADGTIAGKNPDERAASAAKVLAAEHATLEYWKGVDGERKLELRLAEIDIERIRALLRVEETARPIPGGLVDTTHDYGVI